MDRDKVGDRIDELAERMAERFGVADVDAATTDRIIARVDRDRTAARRSAIATGTGTDVGPIPTDPVTVVLADGGQVHAWQSSPLAWSVVVLDAAGEPTEAYVFGGETGGLFASRFVAMVSGR